MNTPINDGGPAFPIHHATWENGKQITSPHEGMSLRDWFAGQALAGLLTQLAEDEFGPSHFAKASYEMADAMLEARKLNTTSK